MSSKKGRKWEDMMYRLKFFYPANNNLEYILDGFFQRSAIKKKSGIIILKKFGIA